MPSENTRCIARLSHSFRLKPDRLLDELALAPLAVPSGAPRRVNRPAMHPAQLDVEARVDAPRGMPDCLHTRFAARAVAAPDATAVVDEDRALSYGELNAAANRLARHLRALGVAPGTRVALAVPRGVEIAVAILAILKAGAAYVPLDPAWPDERRRQMIAESAPAVVLIGGPDAAMADAAASVNAALVDLHADAPCWARLPATELDHAQVGIVERDAAYVIFTSGTTGRPKGVVVEHAQVVSLLDALEPALGLDASDVWTLFHSIAFDFSVWELFGALLSGARLVIVPHTVARTPDAFYALICREAVTVLSQTPGAFRPLIDAFVREPLGHRPRHVLFAGEPLDASMLARWWASSARRDTMFTDLYGITECGIHTTWRTLGEDDARPGAARDVGHAIDGRRVYVLDERCLPVPPGVAGEIWIGGEGLARGYLDRPALTAQRFVPDSFASQPGARMYRSGDLGRLGIEGALEYLGRADDQVKIRGFRIEPREIATRLEAHPAVAQAIVRALADDAGGRRLVAYFTARTTAAAPSPEALRAHLTDHLPDYMTPVAYVRVAAFSLTFNGKIDHAALPLPSSDDYSVHAYEAPCGETETWLAEVWSTLLGIARVGRHDDFFELGGHSLLVAQLIARVRQAFDVDLPMSDLFDMPVLHAFAARIVDARLAQFDPTALARLATEDGGGDD